MNTKLYYSIVFLMIHFSLLSSSLKGNPSFSIFIQNFIKEIHESSYENISDDQKNIAIKSLIEVERSIKNQELLRRDFRLYNRNFLIGCFCCFKTMKLDGKLSQADRDVDNAISKMKAAFACFTPTPAGTQAPKYTDRKKRSYSI